MKKLTIIGTVLITFSLSAALVVSACDKDVEIKIGNGDETATPAETETPFLPLTPVPTLTLEPLPTTTPEPTLSPMPTVVITPLPTVVIPGTLVPITPTPTAVPGTITMPTPLPTVVFPTPLPTVPGTEPAITTIPTLDIEDLPPGFPPEALDGPILEIPEL